MTRKKTTTMVCGRTAVISEEEKLRTQVLELMERSACLNEQERRKFLFDVSAQLISLFMGGIYLWSGYQFFFGEKQERNMFDRNSFPIFLFSIFVVSLRSLVLPRIYPSGEDRARFSEMDLSQFDQNALSALRDNLLKKLEEGKATPRLYQWLLGTGKRDYKWTLLTNSIFVYAVFLAELFQFKADRKSSGTLLGGVSIFLYLLEMTQQLYLMSSFLRPPKDYFPGLKAAFQRFSTTEVELLSDEEQVPSLAEFEVTYSPKRNAWSLEAFRKLLIPVFRQMEGVFLKEIKDEKGKCVLTIVLDKTLPLERLTEMKEKLETRIEPYSEIYDKGPKLFDLLKRKLGSKWVEVTQEVTETEDWMPEQRFVFDFKNVDRRKRTRVKARLLSLFLDNSNEVTATSTKIIVSGLLRLDKKKSTQLDEVANEILSIVSELPLEPHDKFSIQRGQVSQFENVGVSCVKGKKKSASSSWFSMWRSDASSQQEERNKITWSTNYHYEEGGENPCIMEIPGSSNSKVRDFAFFDPDTIDNFPLQGECTMRFQKQFFQGRYARLIGARGFVSCKGQLDDSRYTVKFKPYSGEFGDVEIFGRHYLTVSDGKTRHRLFIFDKPISHKALKRHSPPGPRKRG